MSKTNAPEQAIQHYANLQSIAVLIPEYKTGRMIRIQPRGDFNELRPRPGYFEVPHKEEEQTLEASKYYSQFVSVKGPLYPLRAAGEAKSKPAAQASPAPVDTPAGDGAAASNPSGGAGAAGKGGAAPDPSEGVGTEADGEGTTPGAKTKAPGVMSRVRNRGAKSKKNG